MAPRSFHWLSLCIGLVLSTQAASSFAAPEEIQVYLDDMRDPGQLGVDVHNNFVFSGRSTPDYAGEQAPAKVYRLTPEFAYGLTPSFELGAYVLTTRGPGGDWHADGLKGRIKYIAPHDPDAGLFWGANFELGRTSNRVSASPWNAELKGILGGRSGAWLFAVNPNIDWSPSPGGGPATAEVDFKLSYALRHDFQLGLESYNELGPLGHLSLSASGARTIYATLDKDFKSFDLNLGIGRGLTSASDTWTLKFIVGTNF